MPVHSTRRCFVHQLAAALTVPLGCGRGTPGLRFCGIPDGDKRELKVRYDAVAEYLTQALGLPVRYVHVPDYTAAVTALATRQIDFAWLGGVTTVQAEQRCPGGIHFIAARERDLHFRSYFIAHRPVAEALGLRGPSPREPQSVDALRALAPALRGRTLSFGAKSSTSGHIMPRSFLAEAGLDPAETFAGEPTYQLKGGHSATLRAVASGAVDFGVLNFAVWEAAEAQLQQQAPVIYVTPEYVDYCLVAHQGMPSATVERLRTTLLGLDPGQSAAQQVLAAFSAERFVAVDPAAWDGIREVLRSLPALGAEP